MNADFESYGLIFGFNTFLALVLQTILTSIVCTWLQLNTRLQVLYSALHLNAHFLYPLSLWLMVFTTMQLQCYSCLLVSTSSLRLDGCTAFQDVVVEDLIHLVIVLLTMQSMAVYSMRNISLTMVSENPC